MPRRAPTDRIDTPARPTSSARLTPVAAMARTSRLRRGPGRLRWSPCQARSIYGGTPSASPPSGAVARPVPLFASDMPEGYYLYTYEAVYSQRRWQEDRAGRG